MPGRPLRSRSGRTLGSPGPRKSGEPGRSRVCCESNTAPGLILPALPDLLGVEGELMPRTVKCPQNHEWPLGEDRPALGGGAAVACPVCGAAPDLEALGAPAPVAAALLRLRDELKQRAG